MSQIHVGEIVLAEYNSGEYIGKAIEDRGNLMLIEVLAVVTHPNQGDLHNPGQADGVAFHERKALSFKEKANVRKRKLTTFTNEVPDYAESLKDAYSTLKKTLEKENTHYSERALQKLEHLQEHFYNSIWTK